MCAYVYTCCRFVHQCVCGIGVPLVILGQTKFPVRVKNIGHISSLFLCKANL